MKPIPPSVQIRRSATTCGLAAGLVGLGLLITAVDPRAAVPAGMAPPAVRITNAGSAEPAPAVVGKAVAIGFGWG